MHRFLWDVHYAPVPGIAPFYPIAAVPHNTAPAPTSPWAMPGQYTVVLTADGKSYTQPLALKMDPRVMTPLAGLREQFTESMELYEPVMKVSPAFDQVVELRKQLTGLKKQAQGETLTAVNAVDEKLKQLAGAARRFPGAGGEEAPSLGAIRMRLLLLMNVFQEADVAPTSQATAAVAGLVKEVPPIMQGWGAIKAHDIPELNAKLRAAGLPELTLESNSPGQEFEGNEE